MDVSAVDVAAVQDEDEAGEAAQVLQQVDDLELLQGRSTPSEEHFEPTVLANTVSVRPALRMQARKHPCNAWFGWKALIRELVVVKMLFQVVPSKAGNWGWYRGFRHPYKIPDQDREPAQRFR